MSLLIEGSIQSRNADHCGGGVVVVVLPTGAATGALSVRGVVIVDVVSATPGAAVAGVRRMKRNHRSTASTISPIIQGQIECPSFCWIGMSAIVHRPGCRKNDPDCAGFRGWPHLRGSGAAEDHDSVSWLDASGEWPARSLLRSRYRPACYACVRRNGARTTHIGEQPMQESAPLGIRHDYFSTLQVLMQVLLQVQVLFCVSTAHEREGF